MTGVFLTYGAEDLASLVLLLINSISDIRRREILLWPTLLAAAAGIWWQICVRQFPVWEMTASLLPGIILFLLGLATGGKIGCGDGIVVCALGAWTGVMHTVSCLFFAFAATCLVAGILRLRKERKKELPFLPFLTIGFVLGSIL